MMSTCHESRSVLSTVYNNDKYSGECGEQ
jgi:hypothetical protein